MSKVNFYFKVKLVNESQIREVQIRPSTDETAWRSLKVYVM